jgi:hypothetical protein
VAVGEPEIVPLADMARPAGSMPPVSAQESGAVPPALSVAVYACSTQPFGSEVVVMLSAGSVGGAGLLVLLPPPPPQLHNAAHSNVRSSTADSSAMRVIQHSRLP